MPEYFENLSTLEASNFWFEARNRLIIWALSKYKPAARNFLEVGCGTGFVLSSIAKERPEIALNGSEIFLDGLSYAATRVPTAQFSQMDARNVPYSDEFDAIGAFDVLEHIKEDTDVLAQLRKALKPDGVLLVTVPQHPWLWSETDEYACHERRYARPELERKMKAAGFVIIKSTSFVTTLLPVMFVSRFFQRLKKGEFDPNFEYGLSPFVNSIFFGLLSLELSGIKLGASYPAGGSRVVVARNPG
jgi:SAM-dependent methyltransferase